MIRQLSASSALTQPIESGLLVAFCMQGNDGPVDGDEWTEVVPGFSYKLTDKNAKTFNEAVQIFGNIGAKLPSQI